MDLWPMLARSKSSPAGLYGCESSSAEDAAVRRLRTAVLAFAGPRLAKCRSPHSALETFAACGFELDP
eukprot:15471944-Alexandrium_andersonii.AAC.1